MKQILPLLLLIALLSIAAYGRAPAPDPVVTGRVVSFLSKEPLVGVTILVKGTNTGVITDLDGTFSIKAGKRDTLIFSYVGYETLEVPVNGQSELYIELTEGIEMLQEIAVFSTGYEEIPAERATGSFVQVDNQDLSRRVSTDIASRLEDITPGLVFNRTGSATDPISIRGRNTLFANANPLIVIDNFPYDGDLNNINPNDVENITVLKDAAAASIWGARAGNGVIVITTKKGSRYQEPKISFNSNVTIGEKPDPFYLPRMSVEDYIEMEKKLFAQDYYLSTENSVFKEPLSPVVEFLIAARDGDISEEGANAFIEDLKQQDVRRDYEKYLYRNTIKQQYSLSISGGEAHRRYYLSAGYDRNLDNLIENQFDRITLNANHSWTLLDQKLEFKTGIYYSGTRAQRNNSGENDIRFSDSQGIYPYARLANNDGIPLPVTRDYRRSFVWEAAENGLLDWQYYPLKEIELTDNVTSLTEYRINTSLGYQILPSLKAEVLYQYWKNDTEGRNHHLADSYFARDLINLYTQVNNDGSLYRAIPEGGILDLNNSKASSHNLRGQLNFDPPAGGQQKHRLSALAGYEIKEVISDNNWYRYYGYDDELANSIPVDYVNTYGQYYLPAYQRKIPNYEGQSEITDRFVSWYGNAAYTYDRRYTLSLSGRKDQSNLFGVKANQKGVPLWSAGLGWTISNESFFDVNALSLLKLRATYGYNGNIDKTVTAYTTASFEGTSFYTGLPYARITNPPNPELQWERIKILNLGLDFNAFDGRLDGSLEYYRKQGLDLIGYAPVAPSTGVSRFRGNTAATLGHGIDLVLNSLNIDGNFQWHTNFLFSQEKNKVTDYKAENSPSLLIQYGDASAYVQEGKPIFSLYSYRWAGLDPDTGDPQGFLDEEVSADYGQIINTATPENIVYHGPARPTVFGSIRNTLSWHNLSLSFNISYRLGYYFRRNSITYGNTMGLGGHGDYYDRWQQPGDERTTNVPSIPEVPSGFRDTFYKYSEVLVEKGDHIRFQDVRLDYTLSRDQWSWLPFESANIYGYVNNIGILWKATDAVPDPDYRTSKLLRTYAIGLKVDF